MVEVSRFLRGEGARTTRVIPLSMRLPNAPAVYIPTGLEESFSRGLDRHRVIRVCGPERVGKRSLTAHVLDAHPEFSLERTIWLDAGALQEPLEVAALRALAELSDASIPWATLISSPRLALELLVDLSDALELCVVCSRAEAALGDSDVSARLCDTLESYCRRARWIFLLRAEHPLHRARSTNSFFLSSPTVGQKSRWLDEVAPPLDVSAEQMETIAREAPNWDALADRLEALHDARTPTANSQEPVRAVGVSSRHQELVALGDAICRGDVVRASAMLAHKLDSFIEQGHAVRVLELLDDVPLAPGDATFEVARMRCLLASRDREALDRLDPPASDAPEVMALWARVLLERGRMDEARRALECAPGTLETRIIAAHIALSRQNYEELAEVATVGEEPSMTEVWLESLLLLGMVWDGRHDQARERLRTRAHALLREPAGSFDRCARHAAINLARALHLLKDLSLASRLIERVQVSEHHSDWSFYDSESLDYFRALLATETLSLGTARVILERMLPWFDTSRGLGLHIRLLLGHVEIRSGHQERALEHLDALLDAPHATELHASARVNRARCIAATHGFAAAPTLGEETAHSALVARSEQEYACERAVRLGERSDTAVADDHFVHAIRALLRGEDADLEPVELERERTREQGLAARQRILSRRLGMLYICAGRFDAAVVAWRSACAASERAQDVEGAASEVIMAQMAAAKPGELSPGDVIAWFSTRPPSVCRRILGVLLGHLEPDRFESLVAKTLCQERFAWEVASRDVETPPTWWFDLERSVALEPDKEVEISARTRQGQLFHALCKRGGEATKAELLADVWGIEGHHPLRDENRLRMAAHKLKRALEELSDEEPIYAVEDGYRVSDRCRWIIGEIGGNQG